MKAIYLFLIFFILIGCDSDYKCDGVIYSSSYYNVALKTMQVDYICIKDNKVIPFRRDNQNKNTNKDK